MAVSKAGMKSVNSIQVCAASKTAGELVKKIEGGWLDFDVAITSPDMMRFVGKLGRQLGPKDSQDPADVGRLRARQHVTHDGLPNHAAGLR